MRHMIVGAQSVGTSMRKTTAPVNCSRTAVINVYRECIPKQKNGYQRQACDHRILLNFTNEQKHWTADGWKWVMWFDEPCFRLHHGYGKVLMWRRQNEIMYFTCTGTDLQSAGDNNKWLATLIDVPLGLGLNPGEDMDVFKCIVTSRHGGTLKSRPAASPLLRLVEVKESRCRILQEALNLSAMCWESRRGVKNFGGELRILQLVSCGSLENGPPGLGVVFIS
ncbi:hypothetical protein TNCV_506401 [Trichonephila clavipes]|nr:hypothetical protein TNCV_506401 [Trichonephila clavipes]